ncbi:hypothetical protein C5Z26_08180 [Lactobacillus sp. CBA3606]|uniref:LPXTG cell wall anchor domain-containing protein n=1 Tax=Lactobacillus sp. CBA3606 TaxID=2099789 RepID=UPI000CFD9AFC|nr:LPXTG cell wall anchor domain-containing protein [Lactobacillus sp. CBA3606]AVK64089.1 hypothetical protein C5Z26_08180 [Lactobacillus sp. CBA3606]
MKRLILSLLIGFGLGFISVIPVSAATINGSMDVNISFYQTKTTAMAYADKIDIPDGQTPYVVKTKLVKAPPLTAAMLVEKIKAYQLPQTNESSSILALIIGFLILMGLVLGRLSRRGLADAKQRVNDHGKT